MPWCFNCSIKVAHKEGLRYIKSADWFISMNPTNWKKLTGFQTANQTLQIHFHQLCPTGGTRELSSPSIYSHLSLNLEAGGERVPAVAGSCSSLVQRKKAIFLVKQSWVKPSPGSDPHSRPVFGVCSHSGCTHPPFCANGLLEQELGIAQLLLRHHQETDQTEGPKNSRGKPVRATGTPRGCLFPNCRNV